MYSSFWDGYNRMRADGGSEAFAAFSRLAQRSAIVGNLPGMFFVKFVVQFIDFHSGLVQRLLAGSRDLIDPARAPCNIFKDGLQEPVSFQAMQKWVECSRPDAIPVMRQFLHHRKAEDGLVRRMYEYMNPYEPEKEFSLVTGHPSNIPSFNLNRISIVYYRFSIAAVHLARGGRQKHR
jgi:hypothetical protein